MTLDSCKVSQTFLAQVLARVGENIWEIVMEPAIVFVELRLELTGVGPVIRLLTTVRLVALSIILHLPEQH